MLLSGILRKKSNVRINYRAINLSSWNEKLVILNLYLDMSVDQRILEKVGLAGSSWIVQFGSKSCRRK